MPSSSGSLHAESRAGERALLVTLAAIQFTHITDFMVIMPLGPQLMRVFEVAPQQFGLLVSAYSLSAALAGLLCALYIDRHDRKHALFALSCAFGVALLLCALAPSYALLLAARVCAGAFGGVVAATVYSIVGDAVPEQRRGAAMGAVSVAFPLAAVAGVPLGLYLATRYGWRAPFLMLAAAGTLALPAIARYVPSLRAHVTQAAGTAPLRRLGAVVTSRGHLRGLAFMAMLTLAGFLVIPFISPYIVANAGVSERSLAYVYFFGGLATAFTSRWAGHLADRHGKARVFAAAAWLSLIPTLLVTNLVPAPLPLVILCTASFMILSNARWVPALALVTGSVPPHQRGSFLNLSFAVQQMAAGLASFVAGLIIGRSPGGELTHYWVVGLLGAAATLAALALARGLAEAAGQRSTSHLATTTPPAVAGAPPRAGGKD